MLRIGDFSQLAQVSVPTLRHYDELGLLKPAHVDPFTDYRYYDVDQLPRLNRILALKDLGLSLDQIKALLKEDVPAEQLRGMLRLKRAEIEGEIAREQARLARVEARLQQIEHEGDAPAYDVVLKRVDALLIAGTMQTVPHVSQMVELRFPTLTRLYDALTHAGIREPALELMIYHNEEYSDDDIHMEAAVALSKADAKKLADQPQDRVRLRELPACADVASTIHNGTLYDIPRAIVAVFAWMGRHGYRSAGPIRELHLRWRELDITDEEMAHGVTRVIEIQVPAVRD